MSSVAVAVLVALFMMVGVSPAVPQDDVLVPRPSHSTGNFNPSAQLDTSQVEAR